MLCDASIRELKQWKSSAFNASVDYFSVATGTGRTFTNQILKVSAVLWYTFNQCVPDLSTAGHCGMVRSCCEAS